MSVDLTTQLGNLKLSSPIIVGSCPLTTDEMQRVAMISNGAGAIVLPSVRCTDNGDLTKEQLLHLERICQQSSVPIIPSLRVDVLQHNSPEFLAKFQAAGASAIEISLQPCSAATLDPRKFEDRLVESVRRLDQTTKLPLLIKLTPNLTSISHIAKRLDKTVDGLVLFGRSPIVDIELGSLSLRTKWGITPSGSIVRSLEPIMRTKFEFPNMSLIACGGIGSSEDLVKALICGADATMVTSALYRDGTSVIGNLREGLTQFMNRHKVSNISQLQELCPSLKDIQSDIKETNYEAGLAVPQTEPTMSQEKPVQSDRFGHPVN